MTMGEKTGAEALRLHAEEIALRRASSSAEALGAMSADEVKAVLHELRVHQIELEMQNDELLRAQVGLDAARARYFDLYDLAPVGYCTLSEAGLIIEANLTAATMLGVARSALVKRPVSRFILKGDQDIYYLCRNELVKTGVRQSCELRMVKDGGAAFWAHLACTVSQDSEGAHVHRVVLSDISDRKRLDQTLLDTNVRLERAGNTADKANRAKSDFLSSMSHELRSPLNAILGFAQLMEVGTPALTKSQQDNIGQILRAGWYLLELINEILDLSAVESGKLLLSLEPISLNGALQDCRAMIEPHASKSAIRVHFPELDLRWFVVADRTRLKQVLVNLVSNGIKYNKRGGAVSVTVHETSSHRLRIEVSDTGEGLPPEKVAQLFQSFNRLGQEGGKEGGTGIGLMVSKRLVELMGGEIGAHSTLGKGSVFWFELNRVAGLETTPSVGEVRAHEPVTPSKAVRTVLYVEDNPANMMLVEKLIARRPDLQVLAATDGPRGIAVARAQKPTVILMDINLPGMNGLEALEILQKDPATAHIPVLALSANAMPLDVTRGMAAGFLGYLTKPIRLAEFMAALDLALDVAEVRRLARGVSP